VATVTDFFLAAAVLLLASAGIFAWQWRATRDDDSKSRGLRAANKHCDEEERRG
jgi:hypothetical protein